MTATRLLWGWLAGLGIGLTTLSVVHGNVASLVFPLSLGATFLLLRRSGRRPRFPGTDLERGLERLFALLLPVGTATTVATARVVLAQRRRLGELRRGARRWGTELQLITTDGYEAASRIAAGDVRTGRPDDRVLAAEAVRVLRAERARAGVDLSLADDPVSMLAYGLGARPATADLTSLEDLLRDLGFSEETDELRTHFDVVAAERTDADLRLKDDADRRMFRDLAGASFVLGAAARILELASLSPARATPARAAVPRPS